MLLGGAGIAYVFLGRELGARPPGKDLVVDGRYSYARLAARPEFAAGIDAVLEMERGSRVALMCAEKDPKQCPRVCALRAASRLTPVVSSRSPAPSDSLSPDMPFPLPHRKNEEVP